MKVITSRQIEQRKDWASKKAGKPSTRLVKTNLYSSKPAIELLREVIQSTLNAVMAKCGLISVSSEKTGNLEIHVPNSSAADNKAANLVALWVAGHSRSLVLETREEALAVPELTLDWRVPTPLVCIPIWNGDETLGAFLSSFHTGTSREELQQKQLVLEIAADLMSHIIVNERLSFQLQEMKEFLIRVNSINLQIQEAERERIILDVHDGIAQTLASALQYLQTAANTESYSVHNTKQYLTRAVSLIRQAIRETREVINSTTPATLELHGLESTLRQELKHFEKETGCQVDFRSTSWPSLPRHMEFAIYRIIREAVNNVRKHAMSSRLLTELNHDHEHLVIRVKDWGIGFIPEKQSAASSHSMGLFSIRRRTELLGGTSEINSSLGLGTELTVVIPWQNGEE